MIIDFHTHIFPDKIAGRTIQLLSEKGGIPPFSDGTVNGLTEKMQKAGTDISVTLPVLTSPSQFESVNRFAAQINSAASSQGNRLISFAGIHPACENIEEKMAFIRDSGFLGVKIHPDYQGTYIDDDGYVEIMRCAAKYDLIVVTHAGVDIAFRDDVHCTPDRVLELISKAPHSKLVLAHMGGSEMYDEVLEKLCGKDLYLDTAYVLRDIGEDTFKRMLNKHGEDKILFATDSPWSDIAGDVNIIKSFDLGSQTEQKIFCENARALLGI